jgi:hypothetical protein
MVKYVANIHGDETVTRELLLALAQYLVWNYGEDDRVTDILNSTEVPLPLASLHLITDPHRAEHQPGRFRECVAERQGVDAHPLQC